MSDDRKNKVYETAEKLSSPLNYSVKEIAIILAAGHGKRIKSEKSKMLHTIWGVPTVLRVFNACTEGIKDINVIIVVGIKAKDVMNVVSKRTTTAFAFQEEQNGTGQAVQVALEKIKRDSFDGIIYVLPGDMGLIDSKSISSFREDFINSKSDMMVLTGIYDGEPGKNQYGRIIRVKEKDDTGKNSGRDFGKVIQIMEYKDIERLKDDQNYTVEYNKKRYTFTKQELLDINEFNSGVYAFDYKKLVELIPHLKSDNAQQEIYITDLIDLFNKNGYSVTAESPLKKHVVMGFNDKAVLKQMENIARREVYGELKTLIDIDDPDDFFIAEGVVKSIKKMEAENNGKPLDIYIGKGVYISEGVKLNFGVNIRKNAYIDGNIHFGRNTLIGQNVQLSTFLNQTMKLGDNIEILSGDIVKGNVEIDSGTRIESGVHLTGTDDFPLRIGKNVLIKGMSYVFGSLIDDTVHIQRSVIIKKRVRAEKNKNGTIKPVRFILPPAEGTELIEDL